MTPPAPDPQQQHDQAEPPTHHEVLDLLRKHFGPDVQVLEVRANTPTVAGARRAQQHTRSWRLFRP